MHLALHNREQTNLSALAFSARVTQTTIRISQNGAIELIAPTWHQIVINIQLIQDSRHHEINQILH